MSKLRVGVIGCGYWGPNLIRNFYENSKVELRYICDLDTNKLNKMASRYPTATPTVDSNSVMDDPDVDAIVIATPVHTHFPLARQALENGKHVMVEKPLAMSSDECKQLIALANQRELTLMVDHTFVYHPAVQRIKQETDKNTLGNILYFDSVRVNLGLFQSDINVIWDLAVHDLSIMQYVLGMTPNSLHATGMCHTGNGIEDIAYLTLKFPSNLIAHFHVSWLSPVKIRKILIGGTHKMIEYDDMAPSEKIKFYDKGIMMPQSQSDEKRYQSLVQYRLGDMYAPALENKEALQNVVAHFVDAIRTGQAPITDGAFGLRVVQYAEAANESLQTGQEVSLAAIGVC